VLNLARSLSGGYGDLDVDTARTMLDEVADWPRGRCRVVRRCRPQPPVFDPDRHTINVPVNCEIGAGGQERGVVAHRYREEIGRCTRARGADVGDHEMLICANPSHLLVCTGPCDGQRALRRGQRTAEAYGPQWAGAGLAATLVLTEAGRRLRCRRGTCQALASPTHMAHRA